MTKATHFNEREQQICLVARMIEDGKTYWVTGAGSPLAAILLAKNLYGSTAVYVTEDGVLAPEPALPFDPLMSMVSAEAGYRALQWANMNSIGFHAQVGLLDYGILNALQIDRYGNINSTAIGDYEGEHRRFGGPGGADSIAALCWRTIVMTDQQKRKFVPRVDFISSPGFLDGSPGARELVGLPRGTGPWRVVTPWALFDYDDNCHLRLIGVSPFVTVEQVLAEMDFEPAMADKIETLDTPTEEELDLLRAELDVRGQITDVGRWIELRDDKFVFADQP
ncbi:MAG: CoA-transferase subunit beta [Dehalococcoidia bacterium]